MKKMNKKKYIIVAVMLLVSLVGAMLLASANPTQQNIKDCAKDLIYGHGQMMQQKSFEIQDLQYTGYSVENGVFAAQAENAKIYLNEIQDYVSDVTVIFSDAVQEDLYLQFYYGNTEAEDEAGIFYSKVMEAGLTQKTFEIRRKVTGLRISIAADSGKSFSLQQIKLNENAERFSMGRLFRCMRENMGKRIWFDRMLLLFVLFFFILLHFVLDIRKMYAFAFDKRWLIAGILLLFLVANKYHGDSLSMYDYTVQPGMGSDYVQPLIGKGRAIRSDEWVVSSPINLSTQFLEDPYGKYNDIIRGTETINDNRITAVTVVNPVSWINIFLRECVGLEYGYSFGWYAPIFLTFLFTIEFFMIITKKNKVLSTCGACMIVLSSYFLWWGFPSFLMNTPAALTCAWHFVHSDRWKYKIPLAFGTGLFTIGFVSLLYPAWQVPLGYTVLAVLVWMIHDSWDVIRKMNKKEWAAIIITLIMTIIILMLYLLGRREYIQTITQTEYPGSRIDYGGFTLKKLFNYIAAAKFAYVDIDNASEAGTCISFFPISFLVCLWLWIRSKKKDWLVGGLMIVSIFLMIYTTIGLPPIIARLTLMTMSTSARAVDILGYIQVILFVCIFSRFTDVPRLEKKIGLVVGAVFGIFSVWASNHYMPGYMGRLYMAAGCIIVSVVAYACVAAISEKMKQRVFIMVIFVSLVTGIYVRPLCKGLDSIYSKPAAKQIMELVQKNRDAKWIACDSSIILPSFAVACGAPTINSVNTYPNMELWKTLDEKNQFNQVYNRYAHVSVDFTSEDTTMELIQEDWMRIHLSYRDIPKTGAEYILSITPLEQATDGVRFDEIYNEAGCYIYQVAYP